MGFCRNEPFTDWEATFLHRTDTILHHTSPPHLHHQRHHTEHGCFYNHHHSQPSSAGSSAQPLWVPVTNTEDRGKWSFAGISLLLNGSGTPISYRRYNTVPHCFFSSAPSKVSLWTRLPLPPSPQPSSAGSSGQPLWVPVIKGIEDNGDLPEWAAYLLVLSLYTLLFRIDTALQHTTSSHLHHQICHSENGCLHHHHHRQPSSERGSAQLLWVNSKVSNFVFYAQSTSSNCSWC